ncbi:uncharacterized protein LOC133194862 isoform X2 [Saccostrea echinata]|uniref:uncharacterized protein LOC133194862 isoform X2 n=1 Tax=Saccostrea echinata TaxID=191078 RepID=UPI002A80A0CC|nr:uncharacterized protein LOC133194862 isoform X2 [Saccostrea echinata]
MAANLTNAKYLCSLCDYSSGHRGNYLRHLQSVSHQNILHFYSDAKSDSCENIPISTEDSQEDIVFDEPTNYTEHVTFRDDQPSKCNQYVSAEEKTNFDHEQKSEWFPFLSKADFYLYVLMNSTTHPVSDEVVKYVVFILKQCGVEDVPPFSSIKRKCFGSFDWNEFLIKSHDDDSTPMWAIKPSAIVKMAVAHPNVSKTIIRYPRVDSLGEKSHPAYGEKWISDLEFCYAADENTAFFKNEVCIFESDETKQMGIIESFVENVKENVKEAVISSVEPMLLKPPCCQSEKAFLISSDRKHCKKLQSLKHRKTYENESYYTKESSEVVSGPINQNHFNLYSSMNMPILTVPVNLFLDDTSTHRSKKWLALHCIQLQLSGIPVDERHKERHVHFVGASEKVEILKLVEIAIADIKQCQRHGVISFDALNQEECMIKCPLDVIVADYNMLSHCCNHLGASADKYCPRCLSSSGTFDQVIHSRKPKETLRTINRLHLRSKEVDKAMLRKETGVKEHFNCLWDVIDPHRDIPVGLLHLVPLGLTKHLVTYIVEQVDQEKLKKMGCHLETLQPSKGPEFFQHIGSRQGRDFKSYLQVAPFNLLFAKVDQIFIKLTCCLALIQKQLYMKKTDEQSIKNMTENIAAYHRMITEFLPSFARKAKTHLLLHAIDDIHRHGPLPSYDEEAFEKNHGRIRDQIFLQNQKARSRDTAAKYAQHILCSHVITGGYFKENDTWTQAAECILKAASEPSVKSFLGLKEDSKKTVGELSKFERQSNGHIRKYSVMNDDPMISCQIGLDNTATYHKSQSVTTQSLDLINSGDWVRYKNSNGDTCHGIFTGGFEFSTKQTLVRVQKAQELDHTDPFLDCPLHELTLNYDYVPSVLLECPCSFFHDCYRGNCRMTYIITSARVEQQNLSKRKLSIKHNEEHRIYLFNKFHL